MNTRLLIIIVIVMMTTISFVTYAMLDWHSDSALHNSFDADTSPKPGDKYYIEPERLTRLVAVEQDLRGKIAQLHQKNPLTAYGVNLDHATKKIIVIVETEQFNSEIEEIISQYPDDIPIVFYNSKIELQDEFESDESPTIYIMTENGDDKLNPHQVVINLEQTNVVTFVNNSPDPVRIQEVGENKISNIPKTAWHTKTIESGKDLTMQFNSTGYYEFNVKKITDFLEGYFEHHATGDVVVLSDDTNSLPVDVRAKMAQSIVTSYFGEHPALHGVGSGGAPGTGVSITLNEKELDLREDAESYYYELYRNLIPFDVPITIKFSAPPRLLTG